MLLVVLTKFFFCGADRDDLGWITRDDLVFGIGSDDFDGDMFESRKEYPLSDTALEEQELFFVREVECFLEDIHRGG